MATSTRAVRSTGIQDYLKLPYARILIPEEDGRFSAEVLEFPGCYSQGNSAGEAFENLEKSATGWIESCLRLGQEIPPPSANQGFGGRIALRLPRSLHRVAVHKAQRDGISLNQCLVTAIAAWVGADNLFERITQKVEMNFFQMNNYQFTTLRGSASPGEITPFTVAMDISGSPITFDPIDKMQVLPLVDLSTQDQPPNVGGNNG
jgi:antitoxin HicB